MLGLPKARSHLITKLRQRAEYTLICSICVDDSQKLRRERVNLPTVWFVLKVTNQAKHDPVIGVGFRIAHNVAGVTELEDVVN